MNWSNRDEPFGYGGGGRGVDPRAPTEARGPGGVAPTAQTEQRPPTLRLHFPDYLLDEYQKFFRCDVPIVKHRNEVVSFGRDYQDRKVDVALVDRYISRYQSEISLGKNKQGGACFLLTNRSNTMPVVVNCRTVSGDQTVELYERTHIRYEHLEYYEQYEMNYIEFECHMTDLNSPTDIYHVILVSDASWTVYRGVLMVEKDRKLRAERAQKAAQGAGAHGFNGVPIHFSPVTPVSSSGLSNESGFASPGAVVRHPDAVWPGDVPMAAAVTGEHSYLGPSFHPQPASGYVAANRRAEYRPPIQESLEDD